MRYPEYLREGETIGICAPSCGAASEEDAEYLSRASAYFASKGYKVDEGPNARLGCGVGISNTPEACARELEDYYAAHGDIVLAVSGGELMCETLAALDLAQIAQAHPKWFMGYSDNTHFGFLLPTMFDTASLYGPNALAFGKVVPGDGRYESVMDSEALFTGVSTASHGYTGEAGYETASGRHVPVRYYGWDGTPLCGRFLGGCLDVLSNMCGTRFDKVAEFNRTYGEEGIVWFLEACDLSAMDIRRSLWHLREAGWFSCAKAFIFGRPARIDEGADYCGVDEYSAVMAGVGELGVPIIFDADLGHLPPAMPFINGGYGTLTPYGANNIAITWERK